MCAWLAGGNSVTKSPPPSEFSGESNRPLTPIPMKSFYRDTFANICVYTTNLYHDTPPICIAMLLQKYSGEGSLEHLESLSDHIS